MSSLCVSFAVMDDEPKVIRYILEHNLISVNKSDVPIGTPLQLAILLKRLNCIKVFLEYNADVDFVNKHKQTAHCCNKNTSI